MGWNRKYSSRWSRKQRKKGRKTIRKARGRNRGIEIWIEIEIMKEIRTGIGRDQDLGIRIRPINTEINKGSHPDQTLIKGSIRKARSISMTNNKSIVITNIMINTKNIQKDITHPIPKSLKSSNNTNRTDNISEEYHPLKCQSQFKLIRSITLLSHLSRRQVHSSHCPTQRSLLSCIILCTHLILFLISVRICELGRKCIARSFKYYRLESE